MNDIDHPSVEDAVTDARLAEDEAVAAARCAVAAGDVQECSTWAVATEAWADAAREAYLRSGEDVRARGAAVAADNAYRTAQQAVRVAVRAGRGRR